MSKDITAIQIHRFNCRRLTLLVESEIEIDKYIKEIEITIQIAIEDDDLPEQARKSIIGDLQQLLDNI